MKNLFKKLLGGLLLFLILPISGMLIAFINHKPILSGLFVGMLLNFIFVVIGGLFILGICLLED